MPARHDSTRPAKERSRKAAGHGREPTGAARYLIRNVTVFLRLVSDSLSPPFCSARLSTTQVPLPRIFAFRVQRLVPLARMNAGLAHEAGAPRRPEECSQRHFDPDLRATATRTTFTPSVSPPAV